VPISLKLGVFFDPENNDQVTRPFVGRPSLFAESLDDLGRTVFDAWADVQVDRRRVCHVLLVLTLGTPARKLSAPLTGVTRPLEHLRYESHVLNFAQHTGTVTRRALLKTGEAWFRDCHLECLCDAGEHLVERQFDDVFVIASASGTASAKLSVTKGAASTSAKHVLEHLRNVWTLRHLVLRVIRAKLVVLGASIGIGERLVRLIDLLELFGIAARFVGVELDGQFTVRLFDLIDRGASVDTQRLVMTHTL
jgi:hypothetical protein